MSFADPDTFFGVRTYTIQTRLIKSKKRVYPLTLLLSERFMKKKECKVDIGYFFTYKMLSKVYLYASHYKNIKISFILKITVVGLPKNIKCATVGDLAKILQMSDFYRKISIAFHCSC